MEMDKRISTVLKGYAPGSMGQKWLCEINAELAALRAQVAGLEEENNRIKNLIWQLSNLSPYAHPHEIEGLRNDARAALALLAKEPK